MEKNLLNRESVPSWKEKLSRNLQKIGSIEILEAFRFLGLLRTPHPSQNDVSRGLRQKENQDDLIPCVLEPVESLKVERPDENAKPNGALVRRH